MATVITEECINCGCVRARVPNTAIYQGGVEYDWLGKKNPRAQGRDLSTSCRRSAPSASASSIHEACAAVCPVDCCVPDPARPESEAVLLERARELHPTSSSRRRSVALPQERRGPRCRSRSAGRCRRRTGCRRPRSKSCRCPDPLRFEVPITCRTCTARTRSNFSSCRRAWSCVAHIAG
jgi:hypothetical protein